MSTEDSPRHTRIDAVADGWFITPQLPSPLAGKVFQTTCRYQDNGVGSRRARICTDESGREALFDSRERCLILGSSVPAVTSTKSVKPRLQMVVGLVFDPSRNFVAMILKKTGPACVVGNWNGIGGKMDPGESPLAAMVREFKEETGLHLPGAMWTQFATGEADNYDLHFFWAETPDIHDVRTVEKEIVRVWHVDDLMRERNVMHNMRWMVPFIQDRESCQNLGTIRMHR